METQRLILFIVFSMSLFFLYEAWQKQHRPVAPPAPVASKEIPTGEVPIPGAGVPSAPSVPSTPTPAAAPTGDKIRLRTDLLEVDVNTQGGVIERVAFLAHGDTLDKTKPYLFLLNEGGRFHVAQTGIAQGGANTEALPNHKTVYEVLPGPRELANDTDKLELQLVARTSGGAVVNQTLGFRRGSYVVDVTYEVIGSGEARPTHAYFQLVRDNKAPPGESSMVPTFTGAAVYTEQDNYKKVEFSDIDKGKIPYTTQTNNGWIGMQEHYFVAAWLPSEGTPRQYYTTRLNTPNAQATYTAGVLVPLSMSGPGTSAKLTVPIYAGPQEQDKLKTIAKGLDLTVDYGIFTVIAAPLFWLLQWLYKLFHNWGWAIVALTILIKLAFYPLNAASARSMGKLKVVGPKLKALQERYANDKVRLQQEMMQLYKTEKINPLGGCLPILVQIPVFIALYWVLLAAVELRQAPWLGWIQDLSAPDPYFILPIIYAITAYLQVKLTPMAPMADPVQQKVMQFMPIAFSVLFIFFPSGLVLYWLINNVLQIAQQWRMNHVLEREASAAAAKRR